MTEHRTPELLAPAGHVEAFHAAVENGADAVYLGLKKLSARASATNFSLDELAHLVPYARGKGVAIHVALNSLVTASETAEALDLLQALSDLRVDAVIVQDAAVFHLASRFFPELTLHASTLMAVHNRAGVRQLARMGAKRVVLARELGLAELRSISAATETELEVFVHGALCYSFSGLCLASSFRGGYGSLQGRCVQPCRLKLRQGKKEGFFLSCSDLCALPLLPELKKMRLAAFKIEGRMKQAEYVGQVVKAYRLVLDAPPAKEADAVREGMDLLALAPSRRLTRGYFAKNPRDEILAPHRSGSSGLWIGVVTEVREGAVVVSLRHALNPGDRLRPESTEGVEREAFTVSAMQTTGGAPVTEARGGSNVVIPVRGTFKAHERLFRVGVKTESAASIWRKIRGGKAEGASYRKSFPEKQNALGTIEVERMSPRARGEVLAIKTERTGDVSLAMRTEARWVVLLATRSNLEKMASQKMPPPNRKRFVWALPPLLFENDLDYYRKAVEWYVKRSFTAWELNNWGHFDLVAAGEGVRLMAGSRLNVRNAAAVSALIGLGCRSVVLSPEITRQELEVLGRMDFSCEPWISVFSWPPLFTSRLLPDLLEGKPVFSMRKEAHYYRKREGFAAIYADHPVNWFEQLPALRDMGYAHFMIDLSDGPAIEPYDFERLLKGFRRNRPDTPFSLFNYDRRP